ncbi:MFS transporter [Musicola paradisiaca]|uniref:Major facilitator superfamily MFS_1 n=2 Tax=Musicola paradisiaca TaxID=69223 RepID=C6C3F5_MUSP7|nr:major facilitator superfamily MFS_1 [Musicola paradisiaca Ech703]
MTIPLFHCSEFCHFFNLQNTNIIVSGIFIMSPVLISFLSLVFIADGLMTFLIPVAVYAETQSLTYSGLSYAIWWLPRLVMIPALGAFIDRIGIRPVSITADAAKAFGCLLLCLVLNFSNESLTLAIACGLLGAVISTGNAQTLVAMEKLIAGRSRRIEHDANLLTRLDLLGMIVGPALGMLLFEYGFVTLLYISATCYLCNAYYFLTARLFSASPEYDEKSEGNKSISSNDKISLSVIMRQPFIILMIVLAVGNNMFDGLIESSGAALIKNNMALSVKYFGFIDICAGAVGFLSTFVYSAALRRLSQEMLLTIGLGVSLGASLLLMGSLQQLGAFLAFYSLGIAGRVFTGNVMRTLRITLIPERQLARASSWIMLLNQSILPFMSLFLFLSERFALPLQYFLYAALALSLLAGMGMLTALRHKTKSDSLGVPAKLTTPER